MMDEGAAGIGAVRLLLKERHATARTKKKPEIKMPREICVFTKMVPMTYP
jgi:hypothetical protein